MYILLMKCSVCCRKCRHRKWKLEADSGTNMVSDCPIPNRKVKIPPKEAHAGMVEST